MATPCWSKTGCRRGPPGLRPVVHLQSRDTVPNAAGSAAILRSFKESLTKLEAGDSATLILDLRAAAAGDDPAVAAALADFALQPAKTWAAASSIR